MTFGLVVMLFGVEEAVRPPLAHIFNWYTVRGWTELIVVISVLGGTMLMSIGMLGRVQRQALRTVERASAVPGCAHTQCRIAKAPAGQRAIQPKRVSMTDRRDHRLS